MTQVFIIGATGRIGGRIAQRLLADGYSVTGLARNDGNAAALEAVGIEPVRAELEDGLAVTAAASVADCTIFAPQVLMEPEYQAVSGMLDALAGSGKRFIFTSGTGVIGHRTAGGWHDASYRDDETPEFNRLLMRRVETEQLVRDAVSRQVDGIVVRPPVVWGYGMHNLLRLMRESHRKTGAVCYVGEGTNCYTSIHVEDLADLYAAAVERGVPGALYHATSGEVPNRALAELVAQRYGCATRSITVDEAIEIWGKFGALIVMSVCSRSQSPRARRDLDWQPVRSDLIGAIVEGQFDAD